MRRVLTVLFLLIFFRAGIYGQSPRPAPDFKNGSLLPANSLLHRKLTHPLWEQTRFGNNYFVIIQLNGIAGPNDKAALEKKGIRLGSWISGKNYLAVCGPGYKAGHAEEAGIKNIYAIPRNIKLSPELENNQRIPDNPKDLIAITCFPIDKNQATKALLAAGAGIVETRIKPAHTWFVHGNPSTLEKLAELPFISSISPIHLEDVPLNYNNRAIHSVQSLSNPLGRRLTGKNLVIGLGDNANPSTHIDLAGKLIMRTDEPVADHGTHTAGILAGGGILNPLYTGMAPQAQLVVNDFSNIIVNGPVYVQDYNMPLTNNSYYNGSPGCPGDGDYNVLSNYVDSQMLLLPKLLHVFAAGNDGGTTCSPFPTSFATIKSGFQTGKNILTVGSLNNVTYGIGNGSSRGPATDGRIKPEIVAGGVYINSTISNNNYASMIGTSMASPTAAGILALITERYRQLHGGTYPDAALLKTLVANSADDLGNPGPDFTFGFGMINGRTTVEALEQNHYFAGTVSDQGSQQFVIPVLTGNNYQLKIMLYWPDEPALPLAPKALVNDLDITVQEPLGTNHLPMTLDPSPAGILNNATEGADHINNIEQVVISNPSTGNYTVTVKGNAVPAGPQSFYIAYELVPNSVTVEYPFGGETWVPGETETFRWSAWGGDPNGFTLEYSTDGGGSWATIDNAVPSSSRSYAWTVPSTFTNQAKIRISRNSTAYTDMSDDPFTILGQPVLTAMNTCPGYAQLVWNTVSGADHYELMKLSGDTMQVITQTTDTSYLVTALDKNTNYWFAVRAVSAGFAGRRSIAQLILPNSGSCTLPAIQNDLYIESLQSPVTGRQYSSSSLGNQRISLVVRNPGTLPTSAPVSYSYQVNGGAVITETDASLLPAGSATVYTFSAANSYDFSAAGTYDIKVWIQYASDTIPANDTLRSRIKNLRNDPLVLNPSFTEGFEGAAPASYVQAETGLDSLDRADFSSSGSNGRLNTFFNTGFARTGNRSILLDVTEQGTYAADSLVNTFNLSGYSSSDQIWLDLYFKKQSPVSGLAGNKIWIRGSDMDAWIPVKDLSDPLDPPGSYIKLNLDLTGLLAAASPAQTFSSSFQVRCGAEGKTPAASADPIAQPGGGISFDDFILTRAQHDAGLRAILQPGFKNICALSNAEKISVLVKNYSTDTLLNVPVTYAVNQDTVTEFIPRLLPEDSLQFTFIKTADMSGYQAYHIKSWISNPTDNYRNNDSSGDYTIQTSPLISQYPYLEGFENNNGFWFSGGQNSSWQWGKPAKSTIHQAANGSNAWVTSLNGNYNDNEYSFLYSPCFDLSSLAKPVLSFSHIFQTEDDCNCDFHWVEYSLDDSAWTLLGNASSGINWYDNPTVKAWQKSVPRWHVSSYDIPVVPPKIRFRIVMYSDPGTNYEGLGIDDIHVFDKAPVFTDSLMTSLSQPVNGSGWTDFEENGQKIFSINSRGQNLGTVRLSMFRDTAVARDTAGQYYGGRNWVVRTSIHPSDSVDVRYYFTDSEANQLIFATGCASCLNIADAYNVGITQYSSVNFNEEDSSLRNNRKGTYVFHRPRQDVQVIPYDNGYYAETTVQGFSEFWLNGGGKNQDHPLAAWLKDFTATQAGKGALLNWASWQETGSLKYIIERSPDSLVFNSIGEMPAVPHPDSIQNYQFTDPSLSEGNNYYRLVLYFQNGDSLVSPVRKIYYGSLPATVQVYPNPTSGDIIIKTPSSCREIQIFDVLGRKLLDKAVQGYEQEINIASFSPGVYFLKLFTDSGNKLLKLEKR